jgi:hypothetical protein
MPFCLCNENWDFCKCDKHNCPKHNKVTERPVIPTNSIFIDTANISTTQTFPVDTSTIL